MSSPTPSILEPFPGTLPHEEILRSVGHLADTLDIQVYAVGGIVRDALLDRPSSEIDFVSLGQGSGIRLAREVARAWRTAPPAIYENFGTAAVRLAPGSPVQHLEFVGARTESYRRDSRKPVVEEGTLHEDLTRRDFTVNAMAVCLNAAAFGNLVDPFDGRLDLAQRVLRTPLDPLATFDDDPLRMVRAARFAAQLEFTLDPQVVRAARARASRIRIVSRERVETELQKIIICRRPSIGWKVLFTTELLPHILPELADLAGVETVAGYGHKDNFLHTLQVLDNVATLTADRPTEETRWLRWAALLHDIAKPQTKRFTPGTGWTFHGHEEVGARLVPRLFRRLKLPTDDRMRIVQELIRLHHRPVALVDEEVTDSAVRRLLFEAGERIDDLMTLVRADITSKNPARVRRFLRQFDRVEQKMIEVEEKDRLRSFQPPVDGEEIKQTLGLSEGIAVGIIKENIREAILEGLIPNEHDAAFAHMMAIKDDALRRAGLFEHILATLPARDRHAIGAIKELVFFGPLPESREDALTLIESVRREGAKGDEDE